MLQNDEATPTALLEDLMPHGNTMVYGPFHKVDNHPNDFSKCSNLPIIYENHELRS